MINSNFSKISLMCNSDIMINSDDGIFVFHMLSIKEEYSDIYDFNFFLGCCVKSFEDFKKEGLSIENISRMDIIKEIIRRDSKLGLDILHFLSIIIQDFEYVDGSFKCGNYTINDEIFDLMCNYIGVASAAISFDESKSLIDESKMSPAEREWERKRRINEEKIRKNKNQNNKSIDLDKVIASVMYEFNISLKDILDMNKYTIYYLYSCTGAIMIYEKNKIAFGNGNVSKNSKFVYWTELMR